jgi:SET domain-containing protein
MFDKYLTIKRSKLKDAGSGVFTTCDIPSGVYVTEMKGAPITQKEYENLPDFVQAYTCYVHRNLYLNAYDDRHFARFVNDANGPADKRFKNNCTLVVDGKKVFIESVKKIKSGSEILVDYGEDYW